MTETQLLHTLADSAQLLAIYADGWRTASAERDEMERQMVQEVQRKQQLTRAHADRDSKEAGLAAELKAARDELAALKATLASEPGLVGAAEAVVLTCRQCSSEGNPSRRQAFFDQLRDLVEVLARKAAAAKGLVKP